MTGNSPSDANRPDPGIGIEFDGNSSGTVFWTTVTGSFGAGIASESKSRRYGRSAVCVALVNLFDNKPEP